MAFALGYGKGFLESNSVSETRNALSVISQNLKKALFLAQCKFYKFIAVSYSDCYERYPRRTRRVRCYQKSCCLEVSLLNSSPVCYMKGKCTDLRLSDKLAT